MEVLQTIREICERHNILWFADAKEIKEKLPTGSNMRGTAEYRSHLAEVMTVRALRILGGDRNAD